MSTDSKGLRNVILGIIIFAFILIMTAAIVLSLQKPKSEQDSSSDDNVDKSVNRIVGGKEAVPHSQPWQALIIIDSRETRGTCAGTLIASRWVLTAAHCFMDEIDDFNYAYVGLGIHSYSKKHSPGSFEFKVKKEMLFFPNGPYNLDRDIALIQLSAPVPANGKTIKYALLPDQTSPEPRAGDYCRAAGWGITAEGSKDLLSDTLQTLDNVEVVPCRSRRHLCTKKPAWEKGAHSVCYGDSGGSLMCRKGVPNTVWGVASHLRGDCDGLTPTYYSRVLPWVKWIKKTMQRHTRNK